MTIERGVSNYLTYGTVGTGSAVATVTNDTPEVIGLGGMKVESVEQLSTVGTELTKLQQVVEGTRAETPWLYDMFPELVESGTLVVKSGHFYLMGVSVTDIFTISLSVFSFGFLIAFELYKLKLSKNK